MEFARVFEQNASLVGLGLRVMFASSGSDKQGALIRSRLAGVGVVIEEAEDIYSALGAVLDDPAGYGLFVIDADTMGGAEAVTHAVARLGHDRGRVPVLIVSSDCAEQVFPDDRAEPVRLRAPLSAVSLRVALEHVLRDRLMWRMAA